MLNAVPLKIFQSANHLHLNTIYVCKKLIAACSAGAVSATCGASRSKLYEIVVGAGSTNPYFISQHTKTPFPFMILSG
jgi:hypothetical protein